MEIDSVTYIYSDGELGRLLDLLEQEGLPFCSCQPQASEDGAAALEKDGIVTPLPEGHLMDKITAFLVTSVCRSDRCLCLSCEDAYIGLFLSPQMCLVLLRRNGRWLFAPFQELAPAQDYILKNLPPPKSHGTFHLKNPRGLWHRELPAPRELESLVAKAASWALFNEIPSGKDASLWKP